MRTSFEQANSGNAAPTAENGDKQRMGNPISVLAETLGLTLTKHLLTAEEASGRIGVSLAHFYRMNSSGELGPRSIRLGEKCSRWRAAELAEWVDQGCPSREKWVVIQESR